MRREERRQSESVVQRAKFFNRRYSQWRKTRSAMKILCFVMLDNELSPISTAHQAMIIVGSKFVVTTRRKVATWPSWSKFSDEDKGQIRLKLHYESALFALNL